MSEKRILLVGGDLLAQIQIRNRIENHAYSIFEGRSSSFRSADFQNIDILILIFNEQDLTVQKFRHLVRNNSSIEYKCVVIFSKTPSFTLFKEFNHCDGLLTLEETPSLLDCLHTIELGKQYISNDLEVYHPLNPKLSSLSHLERLVLLLASKGMSTKQIAEKLHRSPKTIENMRYSICRKMDLNGSNSLLKYALENQVEIFKFINYEASYKEAI